MSAQTLRIESAFSVRRPEPPLRLEEADKERPALSGLPFEVAYQVIYGPEAKPEDLAREYFLLECD